MSQSIEVAETSNLAAPKAARLSTLGFFMSLPPVLVLLGFIGVPIVLAFAFSLGHTSGPNEIISLIGQEIYEKDSWWGTFDA